MDKEIKRTPLPEGFKLKKKEEDGRTPLPEGFKLKKKAVTAQQRDEAKLQKAAMEFAAPEKTAEELKNMSVEEKQEYIEDLNREREYVQSGEFTKGALSGATFGLTENIAALKPIEFEEFNPYSISATGGKVAGSLIPLSKLVNVFQGPVSRLALKSPVFQKQLSSLGTMFGVGATSKGLETLAKGELPSVDDLLEHGIEWAALDAIIQSLGYGGRFAKALFTRSAATGTPRTDLINRTYKEIAESGVDMANAEAVGAKAMEILERPLTEVEAIAGQQAELVAKQEESQAAKVAEEALKPEEITPKDLKTRKITDEPVNRLMKNEIAISEPYQSELMNFSEDAAALEQTATRKKIDAVGTRTASEEELGATVKGNVEKNLKELKEEYAPLYKEAEEAAGEMHHFPEETPRAAGERLRKIDRLETKPAGYETTIKKLETALKDSGYLVQRDAEGAIEHIVLERDVLVSDTIELAKRLNEIAEYEVIEPSVKKAINGVARAAKQDIRTGLAGNADALTAFELAEQAHAQTAQKFSKDSIHKLRSQKSTEKIAKMIESPSMLNDLKQVLSPEQMMQVEREILEKLHGQNYEKAQKQLREVEKHLSGDNRKLARDIVEAKNPNNPQFRKQLTKEAVIEDMSESFTNGTRPDKTLKLWKTAKGQKLVKDAFHNSPNWPKVKSYLEKQSFNDMVSSVLKKETGKLDLAALKKFMKDPAAINNIRAQGGEEAVTFFKNLDTQAKQMEKNLNLFEKMPSKEQIQRGRSFKETKDSAAQMRLKRGVEAKKLAQEKAELEATRVQRETGKIGQKEIKPKEVPSKEHIAARKLRGDKILKRMTQKDYPVQAKINDWKEYLKETLGLNGEAVTSLFGNAKFRGSVLATLTLGLPKTVATAVGYKLMNKMLTSRKVRQAFIEASKHHVNSFKFIMAIENLNEVMDELD